MIGKESNSSRLEEQAFNVGSILWFAGLSSSSFSTSNGSIGIVSCSMCALVSSSYCL